MTTTNHQKFNEHLDGSQEAVCKVAQWLTLSGQTVIIPPISRVPNHESWKEGADTGDLLILRRVEVKQLSTVFTCLSDWPHKRFIVCAKHAWDRAAQKPEAFIILNAAMTHAAVVKKETQPYWTTGTVEDSRYTGKAAVQEFYFCPLDLVEWKELEGKS